MRPLRVLVGAAVLGTVLGTTFAFRREAEDEKARQALEEAAGGEVGSSPELDDKSGLVKLAAVQGLPPYPGAHVRPISSADELDVAWFSTKDSVEQVLSFYERELVDKGVMPVSHQYSEHAGYAGYLDLPDRRMHLVSVIRQSGETLVFPSTSLPEKMLAGGAAPPAGVPNIAGAESTLGFDLGGGPDKRQVWLATYANQSLEQVTAAWRSGLEGNGWQVKRTEEQGEPRLAAERAGSSLQVAIRRDPGEKVAVYVTTAPGMGAP
ncbi:MAG: hypothetical protein JNK82_42985 [Myxococcaceae bacterium]|nr:hypothetical protein [Myxococcaceae bacterium]